MLATGMVTSVKDAGMMGLKVRNATYDRSCKRKKEVDTILIDSNDIYIYDIYIYIY